MQSFVLTLHIIACLILVLIVLLQSGKEGMGVIFGGGSGTVFGSSGAGGLLTKITAFLAALFLITSLGYNILIRPDGAARSLMLDTPAGQQAAPEAPAAPQGVDIEDGADQTDSAPSPQADNGGGIDIENGASGDQTPQQ